jgi:nucleotide-binding universal stress UspA family protein
MSKPVVLGYDRSAVSDLALEWAVTAARDRNVPLQVVVCWSVPATNFGAGMGASLETELVEELRSDAEAMLTEAVQKAAGMAPDLAVSGATIVGSPAASLVGLSEGAALLVVGSHGRGGFAGLLLGSVSRQVAAHAKCPVVVVREPSALDAQEVVVGVDGSPHALRALTFAFELASRRGLRLRVLHAWEVPPIGVIGAMPTLTPQELLDDIRTTPMSLWWRRSFMDPRSESWSVPRLRPPSWWSGPGGAAGSRGFCWAR